MSSALDLARRGRRVGSSMRAAAPTGRAASLATVFAFFVATGEMVMMATPFAAYFYGVYSPVLRFIQSSPYLSWLTDFWVGHVAPGPVAASVEAIGIALAGAGLGLFSIHAVHLYWMKFRHGAVATRLLYAHVRHPQYTCLLVAGVGLALLWPRFLSLVLLVAMAGAYAALARHEESRMRHRCPGDYREYAARTPMLFPWLAGRWSSRPGRGLAVVLLGGAILLVTALGVREVSVRSLRTIDVPGEPAARIVAYTHPLPPEVVGAVSGHVTRTETSSQLLYVVRESEVLEHLLVDAGVRAARELEIPSADFYVVRAIATHPSGADVESAGEAFGLGVVRRLDAVHALHLSGPVLETIELPAGAYAHSSVPLL